MVVGFVSNNVDNDSCIPVSTLRTGPMMQGSKGHYKMQCLKEGKNDETSKHMRY